MRMTSLNHREQDRVLRTCALPDDPASFDLCVIALIDSLCSFLLSTDNPGKPPNWQPPHLVETIVILLDRVIDVLHKFDPVAWDAELRRVYANPRVPKVGIEDTAMYYRSDPRLKARGEKITRLLWSADGVTRKSRQFPSNVPSAR
eukprot:gnl/Trimastix_PCT/3615.p1 GENE.gnl/Trimastix_PCT/3615~~gnl/Trimastix_PCT/3615.p1  ORF type:complete len:146 (+),score=9.68 gnl/Trimastix_PCT/3615:267-704(+)